MGTRGKPHTRSVAVNRNCCFSYYLSKTESEVTDITILLFRTFERPVIPESRLQENVDLLLQAITSNLKSKSRGLATFSFHHDCHRFLFKSKGRDSSDGKSRLLEKTDFDQCEFHSVWDQCLDKNGDGVRIKFPIKMHVYLGWSPTVRGVQDGVLVMSPKKSLEKVTIDFVRQPFSVVNLS